MSRALYRSDFNRWCEHKSLLDQIGVQLGGELDPGDFVTLPSFLGEEGKRKDVRAVDEPVGTEKKKKSISKML